MPSVKKNFAYSSVLTLSNYIFPLIVFPYVSRVLGVANIGICNFVDSIIQYFIVFSTLGISTLGIREIAKNRYDYKSRSYVFSALVIINFLSTLIAIAALLLCIYFVPQFYEHKILFLVGAAKLFFNFSLIEWLYKGVEDFRYITNRSIIVRFVYVISIFLFVRQREDYIVYYSLTCVTIVINAFINLIHSRKIVTFFFHGIKLRPYLYPVFVLGLYQIVTSLHTTFNTVFLGFISTDEEVGYYTTAYKLFVIIIAIFTAFTGVMMPRMSSLIADEKIDDFKNYINKSFYVLIEFSIPIIIFSIIYTPEIVKIIAGDGYEGAISPMRISIPLIFIIGYEQIQVIQVLMPMKRDKDVFKNSCWGAFVGLLLNFIMVPVFASVGSAVAWLGAEITVLILAQLSINKTIVLHFPIRKLILSIISYSPLVGLLFFVSVKISDITFVKLIVAILITISYFLVLNMFIMRESLTHYLVCRIIKKN